MALDLFQRGTEVLSSNYKSADSHQNEVLIQETVESQAAYEEAYVVTTGKTLYISFILMSMGNADLMRLATGSAGSEVDFLKAYIAASDPMLIMLPTPIKFSSGTRISVYNPQAADAQLTMVGWEQ